MPSHRYGAPTSRRLTFTIAALLALAWIGANPMRPSVAVAASTSVSVTYNLRYGPEPIEVADVYRPTGVAGPLPAVLVVHGGGWSSGSKGGWADRGRQLAAAGFVAVVPNYQLASETVAGFPHQLHELKQAITWIRADAGALHADPRRIGAMGSSAGGNLVAMLATDGWGPLDSGDRLRAAVTWSAILDLTSQPGLTNAMGNYVGCHIDCTAVLADASPIHHVSTGDTPIELFNSAKELVPLRTVTAMDLRLTSARVPHKVVIYPGSAHGVSYGDEAMVGTIDFLHAHLS